jgi:hypothetical protein
LITSFFENMLNFLPPVKELENILIMNDN